MRAIKVLVQQQQQRYNDANAGTHPSYAPIIYTALGLLQLPTHRKHIVNHIDRVIGAATFIVNELTKMYAFYFVSLQ